MIEGIASHLMAGCFSQRIGSWGYHIAGDVLISFQNRSEQITQLLDPFEDHLQLEASCLAAEPLELETRLKPGKGST